MDTLKERRLKAQKASVEARYRNSAEMMRGGVESVAAKAAKADILRYGDPIWTSSRTLVNEIERYDGEKQAMLTEKKCYRRVFLPDKGLETF